MKGQNQNFDSHVSLLVSDPAYPARALVKDELCDDASMWKSRRDDIIEAQMVSTSGSGHRHELTIVVSQSVRRP